MLACRGVVYDTSTSVSAAPWLLTGEVAKCHISLKSSPYLPVLTLDRYISHYVMYISLFQDTNISMHATLRPSLLFPTKEVVETV